MTPCLESWGCGIPPRSVGYLTAWIGVGGLAGKSPGQIQDERSVRVGGCREVNDQLVRPRRHVAVLMEAAGQRKVRGGELIFAGINRNQQFQSVLRRAESR